MHLFRGRILWASFCLLLAGLPLAAQQPPGWDAVVNQAIAVMGNKPADAVALFQKVVDANPNFGEGHSMLAMAHSAVADALKNDGPAEAPIRRRHLEAAARHYRRAIELTHVNRSMNQLSLAEVYGPGGLNQPREAETTARSLVGASAADRHGHALLAWALLETGQSDAAAAALRKGRAATPPEDRLKLGVLLSELAKEPATSVPAARALLGEAVAIADEAITATPANGQAYMFKSAVLEIQADKVEQDAGRKAALKTEASGLWEKGRGANRMARDPKGGATAFPPPPPPPQPGDAVAEAHYKRGVALYDKVFRDPKLPPAEGRKLGADASAALDEALKLKPDYMEALIYKSLVLRLQAEKFESDPAKKKALIAEADGLRARAMELRTRKYK